MKIMDRFLESALERPAPDYPYGFFRFLRLNFFFHLRPLIIPKHATSFIYCFGGITLLLFLILTFTGVLLLFYYVPSTAQAYETTQMISYRVPFGWLIRAMHRWAAHGMVIMIFLHMLRVFFTAAYKPPRQMNWMVGVSLFLSTLALAFTGYLLPWDQLAYWAVTIGTEMAHAVPLVGEALLYLLRGGGEVGQEALIRFYALHSFVLPMVAGVLIFVHLWKVRKQGISGPL